MHTGLLDRSSQPTVLHHDRPWDRASGPSPPGASPRRLCCPPRLRFAPTAARSASGAYRVGTRAPPHEHTRGLRACPPRSRARRGRWPEAGSRLARFRARLPGHVLSRGRGLLVVVAVVLVTFAGTQLAGPRLGISKGLSLLVATGFSICGVSAIAAAKDASAADEEEITYAIALVTLCGSLAIVTLPALRPLLGLDDHAYGMWVGASVHDVAQVVATASAVGGAAVTTAIVVKLTRVLLLGPLVSWIAWREGRHLGAPVHRFLPPFILAFVAAALLRSADLVPDSLLSVFADAKSLLLTLALFAVGCRVDVRRLVSIGLRPLALGLCSWAIVAGVAYVGVRAVSG
ncbi:MAG: putative sulfate exporter family transporter [Gaiella sp.]|nr:putative sulfate exporter family transporter [Gaiella sp.]